MVRYGHGVGSCNNAGASNILSERREAIGAYPTVIPEIWIAGTTRRVKVNGAAILVGFCNYRVGGIDGTSWPSDYDRSKNFGAVLCICYRRLVGAWFKDTNGWPCECCTAPTHRVRRIPTGKV